MGIAASSAVRDETAANGPAYGSLEALGGPRKLKKKPVLVLDPEELEKAHAMFHEASAELLGDEVERAPKPAMILGLAPMEEDDPEELGESDEIADDGEEDLPDAEAVLSLTRRKSAPVIDQSSMGLGDIDMNAEGFGDEGYADPNGPIEDDIDLENRIFPSLPIQPETPEEDVPAPATAEPAPIEAEPIKVAPVEEVQPVEAVAPKPAELPAEQIVPDATPVDTENADDRIEAPIPPLAALQARLAARHVDQEAKAATTPKLTELPESYETLRERHKKDWYDLDRDEVEAREVPAWRDENWSDYEKLEPSDEAITPTEVTQTEAPPAPIDVPVDDAAPVPPAPTASPVHNDEPPVIAHPVENVPAPPPPVEEEWSPPQQTSEPVAPAEPIVPKADEYAPEPASTPVPDFVAKEEIVAEEALATDETPADEPAPQERFDDDSVTITEDDNVDGYAFMRDPRSRRSAVLATTPGQQSALRAKLLREAELEAEEAAAREESLLKRFWNWLRGLFG